jgi:hypothetical protein
MICTPQIKKRWVGNIASVEERICTCRVLEGEPNSPGVGWRIILK